MRPNVDEQLRGLGRILDEVVAPAVDDPYASDVLTGVVGVLAGIANGWADVAAFLEWDARETLALLVDAAPGVDTDVVDAALMLAAGAPDLLDVRALEEHHTRVRGLLAIVAPALPEGEHHARVAEHMRARVDRYPIRTVHRMPGQR